jgi:hypothetical protein
MTEVSDLETEQKELKAIVRKCNLSRATVLQLPILSKGVSRHWVGGGTMPLSELLRTVNIYAEAMEKTRDALLAEIKDMVPNSASPLSTKKKTAQIETALVIQILEYLEKVGGESLEQHSTAKKNISKFRRLVDIWNKERPMKVSEIVPFLSEEFHESACEILESGQKGNPKIQIAGLWKLASEMHARYEKIPPVSYPATLADVNCDEGFLPHFSCRMDAQLAYNQIKDLKKKIDDFKGREPGLVAKLEAMGFEGATVRKFLNGQSKGLISRRLVATLLGELNPDYRIERPEIPYLIAPNEFLAGPGLS